MGKVLSFKMWDFTSNGEQYQNAVVEENFEMETERSYAQIMSKR